MQLQYSNSPNECCGTEEEKSPKQAVKMMKPLKIESNKTVNKIFGADVVQCTLYSITCSVYASRNEWIAIQSFECKWN